MSAACCPATPAASPSGPPASPIAWQADLDGYQTIIFPHEHGIFSADPSIRFGIGGYLAMTA